MKTTVEALQDLYVAKGGTLSDVENITTIPDMIEALSTLSEGESQPVTSDEINEIINGIN